MKKDCPKNKLYILRDPILKEEVNEYYLNYIKFPYQVRKMIYTTNSESLNKKIRKAMKNKQLFEKPGRLLDYLFVVKFKAL